MKGALFHATVILFETSQEILIYKAVILYKCVHCESCKNVTFLEKSKHENKSPRIKITAHKQII